MIIKKTGGNFLNKGLKKLGIINTTNIFYNLT